MEGFNVKNKYLQRREKAKPKWNYQPILTTNSYKQILLNEETEHRLEVLFIKKSTASKSNIKRYVRLRDNITKCISYYFAMRALNKNKPRYCNIRAAIKSLYKALMKKKPDLVLINEIINKLDWFSRNYLEFPSNITASEEILKLSRKCEKLLDKLSRVTTKYRRTDVDYYELLASILSSIHTFNFSKKPIRNDRSTRLKVATILQAYGIRVPIRLDKTLTIVYRLVFPKKVKAKSITKTMMEYTFE